MNFFESYISPKSIVNVLEVLKSGYLSEGNWVTDFEEQLKKKFRFLYAATTNSGTSALHLALLAAGIKEGDEVILSPQTFIASALAVLYCGAKVIFCDIDVGTGNIDPSKIEYLITEKTKAILVVHWAGYPADLKEINDIAKKYNLKVIEDAAHALGAKYKNEYIGSNSSNFICFSFQAIKNLTTSDGGLVTSMNPEDDKTIKNLRWFNINREDNKAGFLGEREYNIKTVGYKYHMNNISAAIGCGNLDDFDYIQYNRQVVKDHYDRELKNIVGIHFLESKEDRKSANWLYSILAENRNGLISKLNSRNIPTSVVHRGIDKNELFGGRREDLISQRYWDEHHLALPMHTNLSEADLYRITDSIKDGW